MEAYSHQIVPNAIRPHISAAQSKDHAASALESPFDDHGLLELLQSFDECGTSLLDPSTTSSHATTLDESPTITTSPYLLTQSLSTSPSPAHTLSHLPLSIRTSAVDDNSFVATSPVQLFETQEPIPPDDSRPRCYEHGCAGRPFANTENYRRHLRERSIQNKHECPYCFCSFTRKGNRDTHLASGRCKAANAMLFEAEPTSATNFHSKSSSDSTRKD